MTPTESAEFEKVAKAAIWKAHLSGSRALAVALVSLVTDPVLGVPFDSDHDQAIVAAWIDEAASNLTDALAQRLKEQT